MISIDIVYQCWMIPQISCMIRISADFSSGLHHDSVVVVNVFVGLFSDWVIEVLNCCV